MPDVPHHVWDPNTSVPRNSCRMAQAGQAGSGLPRYYSTEACAVAAATALLSRMQGNVQARCVLVTGTWDGSFCTVSDYLLSRQSCPQQSLRQAARVFVYDVLMTAEAQGAADVLPSLGAALDAWPQVTATSFNALCMPSTASTMCAYQSIVRQLPLTLGCGSQALSTARTAHSRGATGGMPATVAFHDRLRSLCEDVAASCRCAYLWHTTPHDLCNCQNSGCTFTQLMTSRPLSPAGGPVMRTQEGFNRCQRPMTGVPCSGRSCSGCRP